MSDKIASELLKMAKSLVGSKSEWATTEYEWEDLTDDVLSRQLDRILFFMGDLSKELKRKGFKVTNGRRGRKGYPIVIRDMEWIGEAGLNLEGGDFIQLELGVKTEDNSNGDSRIVGSPLYRYVSKDKRFEKELNKKAKGSLYFNPEEVASLYALANPPKAKKKGPSQADISGFSSGMRRLRFNRDRDRKMSWTMNNRELGYDYDSSDDERNDSFYDSKSEIFYDWANPIVRKVVQLSKKYKDLDISIEKSAEYGAIMVHIEE